MVGGVAFFGVVIMALGAWTLASPRAGIGFLSRWCAWTGVWGGALLRVLLAMVFWLAADASRAPVALRVIAVVSLIVGLALLFGGAAQLRAWIAWWAVRPDRLAREWAMVAVLCGGLLVWVVFPNVKASWFPG